MSQNVINTCILDLVKIVISKVNNRENSHVLLARELKTINSNSFSEENKTLKLDIQTYLSELVKLVEALANIKGTNPTEYITKVGDKDTSFKTNYLPKFTELYNKAKASTGDYSNRIDPGIINEVKNLINTISNKLTSIKNAANDLKNAKANQQQPTTPTALTNGSVQDVDDLVREYNDPPSSAYFYFSEVNEELSNSRYSMDDISKDTNIAELNKYIFILNNHINLIKKYKNDILKFKDTNGFAYTQKHIDKSIQGLNKDISILNELITRAKAANQDTNVNASQPSTNQTQNPASTETNQTQPQAPTTPTNPTPQIPQLKELPVDQWGIRFTTKQLEVAANQSPFSTYYMSLLPARQSTVPIQGGRDVPNAMPGLNFKFVPAISKQQIPGFSPIYQNLGVKGLQVIIVGAFTGADGEEKTVVDDPKTFGSNRFSSTLGGMTIADNPFREPKAELNAYNAYLAFQKLAYEGKQIEVEINTAQVYKDYGPSPYAETLKLQDPTSGNPQFTGVIRNLDVYHATQERTWYTLVLDVTNFNMASKENINLNVSLQAAITQAQADMQAANNQAGTPASTQTNDDTFEETANAATNAESTPQLEEKLENIKEKLEATNDEGQKVAYSHMLRVLDYIQKSKRYVFGNYYKELVPVPYLDYFVKSIANLGVYDDINFAVKDGILIVSARIDCQTVPITEFTTTCAYHFYWKIDSNSKDKIITRYWKNRSDILAGIFENRGRGRSLNPDYKKENDKYILYDDKAEMTTQEFNRLTSGIVGWNEDVAKLVLSRFAGCAGASVITAGFGLVAGPPVALAVLISGLSYCGFDVIAQSIQATQEFNKNAKVDYFNEAISALLLGVFFSLGGPVVKGVVSKSTGKGFRQGFTRSLTGGSSSGSQSKAVTNLIDDLINKAKSNIGKEINFLNKTLRIEAIDGVRPINGKPAVKLVDNNGVEYIFPIEDIANELDNILVTSSRGSLSIDGKLDDAIKNLNLGDNEVTQSILSLPKQNKQQILTLFNRSNKRLNRDISIKVAGKDIKVDESTILDFQKQEVWLEKDGVVINQIRYSDIESSTFIKPNTPTKQPTQQLTENPVPKNQSITPDTPNTPGPNNPSGTPQPGGRVNLTDLTDKALDNYNKLLPFNETQFVKGKEIVVTIKDGNKTSKIKIKEFYIVLDIEEKPYILYLSTPKLSFKDRLLKKESYNSTKEILEFDDIVDIQIPKP